MDDMTNQELCILLESIQALLDTDNTEKAKEVIKNAIKRIDKTQTIKEQQPANYTCKLLLSYKTCKFINDISKRDN